MIVLDEHTDYLGAKIKIVGVGGGGGNAVNSMVERGLEGCEFVVVNTDMQALAKSASHLRVQVGKESTRGLGAGANPNVGRSAVEEDRAEIEQSLAGADMVFVTAGMGGGTGTGGAPIVAEVARKQGALVVGIVTRPFDWEGKPRQANADRGIRELKEHVDTLIVIPNQRLLSIIDKKTGLQDAFRKVDDVLYNATAGIARIITGHGLVNVDFADVRTVMADMGDALMGTGIATGEHRATEAAQNAISSPLLDGIDITGSQGVLINIAASPDMTMLEVDQAVKVVNDAVGDEANIIFGVVLDENLEDRMMVTVIATGFNKRLETARATAAEQVQNSTLPSRPVQVAPVAPVAAERPAMQPVPHRQIADHVPSGPDQLEQYNVPAYMRRGSGINRGGIEVQRPVIEEQAVEAAPVQEEVRHQEARRASVDRPAFLRRIMD